MGVLMPITRGIILLPRPLRSARWPISLGFRIGPVARKLRYHLIGSIALLKKTLLHDNRWLPSRCTFPLSAGTGIVLRPWSRLSPRFDHVRHELPGQT
jgi:hypothetical protein